GFGATGEPPCAYKYAAGFHLHHEYGGAFTFEAKETNRSQLENALQVIKKNNEDVSDPDHPVTSITIDIGANDILHRVAKCEAEVQSEYEKEGKSSQYGGATPEESVKNCIILNASP